MLEWPARKFKGAATSRAIDMSDTGQAPSGRRHAPRLTFAGQPMAAWAFAIRIWIAMMTALYVAFWLQLDSASSAAVTVAILAQPKRGQAMQKAVFRIAATLVGFGASILITVVIPQTRDMFVAALALWLAAAVYFASHPRTWIVADIGRRW